MAKKEFNYIELGIEEFIKNQPKLVEDLAHRAENESSSLGLGVEEYHEQLVLTAYMDKLSKEGIQNILEYHVARYEKDPIRAREVITDYHKSQADALGISWEEYKILNRF
jgi:hypothetical protein